MTFLTAKELTQLRADAVDLLPDTCEIKRPTSTNTDGYTAPTWATVNASANCRLDPENSQDNTDVLADREGAISRYILTLEWNEDIQDGDIVVIDDTTYQVTQIHEAHSKRMVRRVRVSQIRGE